MAGDQAAPCARVLLAHGSRTSQEDIAAQVRVLKALLDQARPEWINLVIPGRDDFAARGETLGWEAWCDSIASGRDYDGVPFFDEVVVPTPAFSAPVGRATARIVQRCLEEGVPVYLWDTTGRRGLTPVARVAVSDQPERARDWTAWAVLIPTERGSSEPRPQDRPPPATEDEAVLRQFAADVDALTALCDRLMEEHPNGEVFFRDVTKHAHGMLRTAEGAGRVTERAQTALRNMMAGARRWDRPRDPERRTNWRIR